MAMGQSTAKVKIATTAVARRRVNMLVAPNAAGRNADKIQRSGEVEKRKSFVEARRARAKTDYCKVSVIVDQSIVAIF